MESGVELATVVGLNARRIRTEAGATLEDVAKAARSEGLTSWGGGRVSDLEHGRVSPTLPTLVALCLALGAVRRLPLTLADLLHHHGPVEITGSLAIRGAALARFVGGEPVELTVGDVPGLSDADVTEVVAGGVLKLTEGIPEHLGDLDTKQVLAALQRSGEAEQRIAKRLGVTPFKVAAASAYLYAGATASEERDRRAGGEASAQKRGRIAREIRAELKGALDGDN